MNPWTGEYTHDRGPLVIGSAALRDSLLQEGGPAKALARKRAVLSEAKVGEHTLWVLGGLARPTRVWTFGRGCVVLVRVKTYANTDNELPSVIDWHPAWAAPDAWKRIRGSLHSDGGAVLLFDAFAKNQDGAGPRLEDSAFGFELAGGTWRAHKQEVTFERVDLVVIRLVCEGYAPSIEAPGERPADPEPLVATEAMVQGSAQLDFVETDGGPVLVLPVAHKGLWHGVMNEAGEYAFEAEPTDYDRACAVDDPIGGISVGPAEAWVLPSPDAVAFHALDDGGLLIRWVGADNPESLLAGALLGPETLWSDTGQVLVSEGGFVILDAAVDGRDETACSATFALPAGRYAVWSMGEFDGEVDVAGTVFEVMVTAIRLRRL